MKKEIFVTNGTNDVRGYTRASTEKGYVRAAKRLWPYADPLRLKIKVWDYEEESKGNYPIIFESMI